MVKEDDPLGPLKDFLVREESSTLEEDRYATTRPVSEGQSDSWVPGWEKYRLVREIARGGMGVVHEAVDEILRRPVALKVLLDPDGSSRGTARLVREAQSAAQLTHPSIVTIYEVGTTLLEGHEVCYVAMEYIEGKTLEKVWSDYERSEGIAVLEQVARAMGHAHDLGVVHRDLKPGNVLIRASDGTPVVTDFGIARWEEGGRTLTSTGEVVGTPLYMAPEQAKGDLEAIAPATDVWALGVMMFEFLTGERPFCGQSLSALVCQIVDGDPKAPREIDRSIDPDLEAICLMALEKPPESRYSHATALARDLASWLEGKSISAKARHLHPWRKIARWAGRYPVLWKWVAISFWLAPALGLAWLYLDLGEDSNRSISTEDVTVVKTDSGRIGSDERPSGSEVRAADTTYRAQVERATIDFESGRFLEAVAGFDRALEIRPQGFEARVGRAMARQSTGDARGSLGDYAEAIRLRPDLAPIYNNRGNLNLALRKYSDALRDFNRALELDPAMVDAFNNRARVHLAMGRSGLASIDLERAIALAPENPVLFKVRGDVRVRQKEMSRALGDYETAIRLNPDYVRAYNARGLLRLQTGDEVGGLADLAESIRLDPRYWEPYYNRALFLSRAKRDAEALADLNRVVELMPRFAPVWLLRGSVLRGMERHEEAKSDYREFLRLQPNASQRQSIESYLDRRSR